MSIQQVPFRCGCGEPAVSIAWSCGNCRPAPRTEEEIRERIAEKRAELKQFVDIPWGKHNESLQYLVEQLTGQIYALTWVLDDRGNPGEERQ
jgi:hypothetical protein